ncbi:MAG TPA: LytR C-terminal domain-containing protein [Gaiellaceae bacterium]|nr:LytR C-terminal domain-containing protein [Gaiellaceae bacterium]
MDHPVDLPAPQPWRSAALIAVSVAVVELCILLVVGIVLFGKFFGGQVEKATDPVAVAKAAVARPAVDGSSADGEPARPTLSRRETSVIVLNGNGVAGAASVTAERVRAKHYRIAATDNAPRSDFQRSLIMYRPNFEREARRLARDLGIKGVSPLDGLRARHLQGAHLAYIVGG